MKNCIVSKFLYTLVFNLIFIRALSLATIIGAGDQSGTSSFGPQWGEDAPFDTYGQIFTPPNTEESHLEKFSFWIGDSPVFTPTPVSFQAYLIEWSGTKPVGDILWESDELDTSGIAHGAYKRFDFDVSVNLDASKTYVFFVSAAEHYSGSAGGATMRSSIGSSTFPDYADGAVVFAQSSGEFDALISTVTWDSIAVGWDTVFEAMFTVEPVSENFFTPGNIIVSSSNNLYEVNSSGQIIQQIEIPSAGNTVESARDIAFDDEGNIHVYNGTFSPTLSTYYTASESWTHRSINGFNTINNIRYGGIDTFKNYVFLTDMSNPTDDTQGVIRYDLESETYVRFAESIEPVDLVLGLDGLLYVLSSGVNFITVYEPSTLSLVKSFNTTGLQGSSGPSSIAVDSESNIYIGNTDGDIQRVDADSNLVKTVTLYRDNELTGSVSDVNLREDGILGLSGRFGEIYLEEAQLLNNSVTADFSVTNTNSFLTFVPLSTLPSLNLKTLKVADVNQIEISIDASVEGAQYSIYKSGDLRIPREQWALLSTQEGTGGALTWSQPTNSPSQFFVLRYGSN